MTSHSPFETLICPSCRRPPEAWRVDPATLTCLNTACGKVYPRLGTAIAALFDDTAPDVLERDFADTLEPIEELTAKLESLEPGSETWDAFFNATMNVRSHYAERPNPFTQLCDELLPAASGPIGSAIDFGCGVGGLAIEVAHRTGASVIGLDSSPIALRWAELASRGTEMRVPVRVTPSRFEVRSVTPPTSPKPGRVRWICGSVLNPPLQPECFDLLLVVNLLDSASDPYIALGQASALLRPGGHLILAQPDAWAAHIAPSRRWLAEAHADWDHTLVQFGLETLARVDGIDWVLHRTDRQRYGYTVHGRIAVREEWPSQRDR